MPGCELCGKDTNLVSAMIEGGMLSVCQKCAKFGQVVAVPLQAQRRMKSPAAEEAEQEIIASDYARLVKDAREGRGLTQEQLAKAVSEKESFIHKIESGKMEPPLKTAAKMEQFLGIKLIEKYIASSYKQEKSFAEGFTIGDLLKKK